MEWQFVWECGAAVVRKCKQVLAFVADDESAWSLTTFASSMRPCRYWLPLVVVTALSMFQ
jgi:hypothetical protein